ncbi:MAG TPA: proton-conducting transporter membrane subunit [Gemmatimonadales bacterium]|nr:proton-conducting transporter membrane subunit [Gemmatimonadales bacterium]
MAFDLGLLLFAVLCVVGVVLGLVVSRRAVPLVVAWLGAVAALPLLVAGSVALIDPVPLSQALWSIPALGPMLLHRDALAGVFLIITAIVFFAAAIFQANSLPRLLGHNVRAYAAWFFALFASIAWVLLAGDVFSFLVAWEIMSIISYLLVGFEDENEQHGRAAYLMLGVSEAGALAAAFGLLLLAVHAGSLDFAALKSAAGTLSPGAQLAVFLLTFFGFGVKAGLVPVNVWLPGAYTAAPAPFVPVLAGATLNLGLYGILRVNADLLPASSTAPGIIALIVGTISALVGILYATTDNDLKTLFAHSSIENAGIVTIAFGAGFVFTAVAKPVLAAIAFVVALYHLGNHALYKSLLFIGTGIVDDRAGTRDLDRLGGLIHRMPWTGAAMLVGVLSIAALPPFNGFVSEWLTLQTLLRSAELDSVGVKIVFALCGAGLALTAALAVTCFAKFFAMGFLGITRSPEAEQAAEPTRSGLVPLALLAVLCFGLGVLPTYVIGALDRAVQPIAQRSAALALVPPFFETSPDHGRLPEPFVREFHDLGAQVGQGLAPAPGLVILHRGESANPVVFAAAPTYLVLVLGGLLLLVYVVVRGIATRARAVARAPCWDGGIKRLLPEMTYTATGFSNPVRVIFHAIFRPTVVEDTRETVAEHFRTAIRRESETVHIVERIAMRPIPRAALAIARLFARMHHGLLNAYVAYALLSLLIVFLVFTALTAR